MNLVWWRNKEQNRSAGCGYDRTKWRTRLNPLPLCLSSRRATLFPTPNPIPSVNQMCLSCVYCDKNSTETPFRSYRSKALRWLVTTQSRIRDVYDYSHGSLQAKRWHGKGSSHVPGISLCINRNLEKQFK